MPTNRYSEIKQLKIDSYELDCPVEIETGKILFDNDTQLVLLLMKLINVGQERIKSVYIEVKGFDDTGDQIPGYEVVEFIYGDVNIDPMGTFGDKSPIVLDSRVRDVEVKITKISITNSDPWRSNEEHVFSVPKQESLDVLGNDLKFEFHRQVNLLHLRGGNKTKYLPIENERVWLCSCGRANLQTQKQCVRCGIEKEWLFHNIQMDVLEVKLADFIKEEEAKTERLKLETEKLRIESERLNKEILEKKRIKKKARIKIAQITGTALLVLTLIIVFIVIPNLKKFQQYNEAKTAYENADFVSAIDSFEKLGDFKDSSKWLDNSRNELLYTNAVKSYNEGNFELAGITFEKLGDYKDSRLWIDNSVNELSYRKAIESYNSGDIETATLTWEELGDYKDSKLWLEKIKQIDNKDTIYESLIVGKWITQTKPFKIYEFKSGTKRVVEHLDDGNLYSWPDCKFDPIRVVVESKNKERIFSFKNNLMEVDGRVYVKEIKPTP